eukprot:2424235-Rhodomonas_salina.1
MFVPAIEHTDTDPDPDTKTHKTQKKKRKRKRKRKKKQTARNRVVPIARPTIGELEEAQAIELGASGGVLEPDIPLLGVRDAQGQPCCVRDERSSAWKSNTCCRKEGV